MLFDLGAYGESVALVCGDGTGVSYSELEGLSGSIAEHCPQRSLVFVLCTNSVSSIAGYVGFMNKGVVPLLLDSGIDNALLGNLIDMYRPSYVWAPSGDVSRLPEGQVIFDDAAYSMVQLKQAHPWKMDDRLALLMSTSGSTGSPKLVRLSAQNVRENTKSIATYLHLTKEERAITSLPMNYVYGLSVINTHLSVGATLVLTQDACYTKGFWELFREAGATSFAGVPFMYETLFKLRFTRKDPPPTLRTMTQAGGKLSADLHTKYAEFADAHGIEFVVMYGASEATARMGYLPPATAMSKCGSMGIPIPGGHFELIDESGNVIEEPETVGELVYTGPNVMLGYATQGEDLELGDVMGGRLETGDMAKRDSDGYYYVVGRRKRFIKIVGKRLNLDEAERLLTRHLNTLDIACMGHDDLLAIALTDESLANEAVEYVFNTMEVNRRMIQTVVVEEIPKNTSGKTLYGKLNELVR